MQTLKKLNLWENVTVDKSAWIKACLLMQTLQLPGHVSLRDSVLFIIHIFTRRNLVKRLFKVEFIKKYHC